MPAAANGVDPLELERDELERLDLLSRIDVMLERVDGRLARLEAKFAEYEPLIEMVKARADRGTWRGRFGTGGNT